MPNFFARAQLSKMFFCFPDPHFKAKNRRRRIITPALLAEYAYALRPGGKLYHITDVAELHAWMDGTCAAHPLFARVPAAENARDPAVACMVNKTEEGIKVARQGGHNQKGEKYYSVWRRLEDDECGIEMR